MSLDIARNDCSRGRLSLTAQRLALADLPSSADCLAMTCISASGNGSLRACSARSAITAQTAPVTRPTRKRNR